MKYIHDDMELRHIALCPIFDTKGENLIRLEPMFIDFGIMEKNIPYKEAKSVMEERLGDLFEHYEGYDIEGMIKKKK